MPKQLEFEKLLEQVDIAESGRRNLEAHMHRAIEALKHPSKITEQTIRICERMAVGCHELMRGRE